MYMKMNENDGRTESENNRIGCYEIKKKSSHIVCIHRTYLCAFKVAQVDIEANYRCLICAIISCIKSPITS